MISPVRNADAGDDEWAPVSNLMVVLMLIFMFVAIVFIRTIVDAEEVFREECDQIFRVLNGEFARDFSQWDAELDSDLTVRFNNPEVLFDIGSDEIRPYFLQILREFFPRYLRVTEPFRADIREIRIEGHTSSEYGELPPEQAYLQNMRLSQHRTLRILDFVLAETAIRQVDYNWARDLLTANGLSSSKRVLAPDGSEDKQASRRVEFRLVSSACQKAGVYRQGAGG